jgi:hypothetical protein
LLEALKIDVVSVAQYQCMMREVPGEDEYQRARSGWGVIHRRAAHHGRAVQPLDEGKRGQARDA